jgi:hypothetical protein
MTRTLLVAPTGHRVGLTATVFITDPRGRIQLSGRCGRSSLWSRMAAPNTAT